jgi:hypothetical protein
MKLTFIVYNMYIHTYIHIYHFVGPQILIYTVGRETCHEKHNTQTKQTTQYQTNKTNVNTTVSKIKYYA